MFRIKTQTTTVTNQLNHFRRFKSSTAKEKAKKAASYTNTVILPKSEFPTFLNSEARVKLDEQIYRHRQFEQLYQWQRAREAPVGDFYLHDGPPYANGDVHIGHAVNKVLKDITGRYKMLMGYRVHFRPGWDCHGLPIELKSYNQTEALSEVEIRQRAKKFAEDAAKMQMRAFKVKI